MPPRRVTSKLGALLATTLLSVVLLALPATASAQVHTANLSAEGGPGVITGQVTGVNADAIDPFCEMIVQPLEGQEIPEAVIVATAYPNSPSAGKFTARVWNDGSNKPTPPGRYRVAGSCGDSDPVWNTPWYVLPAVEVVVSPGASDTEGNDARNIPTPYSTDSRWWEWPDGDGDGLPDHWELNGVWVGDIRLDLVAAGANVARKDLFVLMDYEEGQSLDPAVYQNVEQAFATSPLNVSVHFLQGRPVPSADAARLAWTNNNGIYEAIAEPEYNSALRASGSISSPWLGARAVPQLAKYFVNLEYRKTNPSVIGTAHEAGYGAAGRAGWVAYNPPVLWRETSAGYVPSNLRGIHFSQASNLMHEIGHTLGLKHFGAHACANWLDDVEPGDTKCQARSVDYHSVMSYAYNVTGVPPNTPGGPNRIDYSRNTTPHYDWTMGNQSGQLRFIHGQFGELATNQYSSQGLLDDGVPTGETESTSFEELTAGITPSAFDAYARTLDLTDGRPDFPQFVSPTTARSTTAGSPITASLDVRDASNQPVTLSVESGPANGTFTTAGTQFVYTPAAGFTGQDTVTVRAGNGTLSTDPLVLTFNVTASTPTTPTSPPNTGSSSDWGSS